MVGTEQALVLMATASREEPSMQTMPWEDTLKKALCTKTTRVLGTNDIETLSIQLMELSRAKTPQDCIIIKMQRVSISRRQPQ